MLVMGCCRGACSLMSNNGADLLAIDSERLKAEYAAYETWLERRTEEVYQLASKAKSKGLDFENFVSSSYKCSKILNKKFSFSSNLFATSRE